MLATGCPTRVSDWEGRETLHKDGLDALYFWPFAALVKDEADEGGERSNGHHLWQRCEGEDPPVGVAHDRAERVVDPCPADATKHREKRDATKTNRLVVQALEAEGLIPSRPTVVGPLALQQGTNRVGLIEDDEVRRRRHADLEAGLDLSYSRRWFW